MTPAPFSRTGDAIPLFTFLLLRKSIEERRAPDGSTSGGGWGLLLFFGLILLALVGLIAALAWWQAPRGA